MPIKRAAYKAIRSDKKKHLRNISAKTKIKTLTKNLLHAIESKNKETVKSSLVTLVSALDKTAQKGIIHRRTASRHIARMSVKASKVLSSK